MTIINQLNERHAFLKIYNIYMDINHNQILIVGFVLFFLVIGLLYKFKFAKSGRQKLKVQLVQTKKLTHDTIIFTFMIPKANKSLGLKVGQHIQIEQNIKGEIVKRKYTPISSVDRVGSFQLLLKIYYPNQQFATGGKMSQFLAGLHLHSKINITLPFGRFNYLGKSQTRIADFQGGFALNKYKNFYMVAGGTGITPIFQIIQYCCDNEKEDQRPGLHLLFANRTENDILMKQILDTYAQKNKNIKVYYSVDQSITNGWTGFTGYINEQKIKKTIPEQTSQTLFMSCGPPILCNNCEKFWKNLGIPNNQMFRF